MKGAIITGGGSGIGRATALELAKEQYTISVGDINIENAQQVVDEIKDHGGEAHAIQVDIRNEDSIIGMVEKSIKFNNKLALLVNNAGVNFNKSVENCSISEFDDCIAINLRGHYITSMHSIPYLKEINGSSIINMASTHAIRTQPRYFPYNASKAGVLAMTRSMAIDLSDYRIRVNAICPGFIKTNILDSELYDENNPYMKKVLNYHPAGRIGKPEDIAYAVAFLASEKASFINGVSLIIDGGRNALTYTLE